MMSFGRWSACFVFYVLALTMPFSAGLTDPRDVMAINNLYISLGSPPLTGWLPFGGDPCAEAWQGVVCVSSNIAEIRIGSMKLGGSLSDTLGDFVSIEVMDFSNNHIGGSIPQNLPSSIKNLSLSGNQFSGSIPFTVSYLSQLSELLLNNNLLTGEIPGIFQQLRGLTILDISANNLTGQLPSSMRNLLSLRTLHLQKNELIGTLDVLEDLPLTDLNVENNLFSGPIPPKLLNIPNFRKGGTPFNTTIITSPPPASIPPAPLPPTPLPPAVVSPPLIWPPPPPPPPSEGGGSWNTAFGPPTLETSDSSREGIFWTTQRIILVVVSVSIVLLISVLCFSLWRCCKNEQLGDQSDRYDIEACKDQPNCNRSSSQPAPKMAKVPREPIVKPLDGYRAGNRKNGFGKTQRAEEASKVMAASSNYMADHRVLQKPLPPPPMLFQSEAAKKATHLPSGLNSSSPVTVLTIASLQQYTNSFSEENIIGEGSLGNVYRAELPEGGLLAVKKLSTTNRAQSDDEFLDLVSSIFKLKHGNIVELLGFCSEHSQRLLVYEYCPNGSLYDALHIDYETHKKLTWNVRIRVALGASRALQFLHEVCHPPVVHQNFKSSNVLLDEKLAVRVADIGLAHLLPPRSTHQMGGYAAPEIEFGNYACQSDVYSLGVVMLELLTGRKSYDRMRPRGEQSLARWAIPRLHDIDALTRMVDPSLNGAYPMKSLSRFADIIARCVQMEPGFRPLISEIVQDLLHMI